MALLRVQSSFAAAPARSLVQPRYVVKAIKTNKHESKSKGSTVQVCMPQELCFARGVLCVAAAGAC